MKIQILIACQLVEMHRGNDASRRAMLADKEDEFPIHIYRVMLTQFRSKVPHTGRHKSYTLVPAPPCRQS